MVCPLLPLTRGGEFFALMRNVWKDRQDRTNLPALGSAFLFCKATNKVLQVGLDVTRCCSCELEIQCQIGKQTLEDAMCFEE